MTVSVISFMSKYIYDVLVNEYLRYLMHLGNIYKGAEGFLNTVLLKASVEDSIVSIINPCL